MPPTALIDALQGVRRRVRTLSVMYGLGIVIAAAAGLLTATCLLDYLLNLTPAPRLLVVAISLGVLTLLLAQRVIRPALAKLGMADLAAKIERAFPAFDDRLRSTVDFSAHTTPGSQVMKDRVMAQAAELAGTLNLNRAVQSTPIWKSFSLAAGAIAVVVLLGAMVGREYFDVAMARLLNPFDPHAWPKRVEIQEIGQLPQRIAAGQSLDVRMHLIRGDRNWREATVYYQYGATSPERQLMARDTDGIYAAAVDARIPTGAANTMTVWMQSGDDSTAPQIITIVPKLALTGVHVTVTPPAYAKEPASIVSLDAAPVTVVYGSSLSLQLTFNKNLSTSQPITLESGEPGVAIPPVAWDSAQGSAIVGRWTALASTIFQVRAVDSDGLTNSDVTAYQVIVRPDEPPTVQLTQPARNEECTPQAMIPLRAIAEDDFGIRSLKLCVTRLGENRHDFASIELVHDSDAENGVTWTRLDASGDIHRWQMDYVWDLSKLDSSPLKPGDVLEYHLEAVDNFEYQGQHHDPVSSSHYRITIMSQDQFTSLMGDLMNQVRLGLVEIRNNQRGLKEQTSDLRNETQKQPAFNKADLAQASELIDRQATAASQAKQSAQKLDDILDRLNENRSTAQDLKELATNVRDDLNEVAEHPMKDAAASIDSAKDEKPDPRNSDLDSAQQNQQNAADKLDQMVSRLGEVGGLPEAIRTLKEILDHQRDLAAKSDEVGLKNLGKRPDQMSPEDQKTQQDNAAAQNALADKTQKSIAQMSSAAQKLQKTDPTASKAMQDAAQTAQQQDVVPQMRSAADQQKQNQQSGTQQAQAQVQIGLQMMLRTLEEAQRTKLEELNRKLADLKQQLQELIRQQSSLNYENLALRGPSTLKSTDPKVTGDLVADAQWPADQIPAAPDLDGQTRLQEQTERNSRSVAKAAGALPDAAQVVTDVSRAADRMGRAITFLRNDDSSDAQRLGQAYDPAQVEALAALRAARDIIAAQAAKTTQALNQQKRDTIRAAYVKILEAQKKIDVDTVAIDRSPRSTDGQLPHRQAVRLAQLPPEQNVLADQTRKLDDDLTALGSIVYIWANKDIGDSMQQISATLGVPHTGVATQAEETRVEEQIQAMIDSLKISPKVVPFVQQASSGGGGGKSSPPPSLPSEAELRLLKQLQQSVNKSTKTISAASDNEQPALVALGGRQGELRDLLDKLLQKSSHGKMKLGAETSPNEKVPEEAAGNTEDAALDQSLLTDVAAPGDDPASKDAALIGKRMSRSRQRLSKDYDPGKVTQNIQLAILKNLDVLIDMARQEQAETPPQQQSSNPQQVQAQGAQPGIKTDGPPGSCKTPGPNPGNGANPAMVHSNNHDVDTSGTPTTDITQSLKEWGSVSPRKRAAVIEAASEKPIEKFKTFIDDYYRALGERSGQQDNPSNTGSNSTPTPNGQ